MVRPVPLAELIETPRLLLRPVGPGLATAILAHPEAAVVAGRGWPHPNTLPALAPAARPGAGPSRGRGYGTELIGALVAWSFSGDRCTRLLAEVRQDNVASRRALERNGFVLDRVAPPYLWLSRGAVSAGMT